MKIDDPLEAYEQQNMQGEPSLPSELASIAGIVGSELAFPGIGGFATEILLKARDVLFNGSSARQRYEELWKLIRSQFEHVETTKASHEDVQKAIQLAFVYDRYERDDKKRERYVKLIGNALRSETHIQDVTTFMQTIEQLNERDFAVLKVLNKTMNKEGDWKPQANPGSSGSIMKLHPTVIINRAQELSVQIAITIGQRIETNNFSREEGYSICIRLQGFGLAHEVNTTHRELPLVPYAFRLSVQGARLLKLLGEDVPNFEWYTRDY